MVAHLLLALLVTWSVAAAARLLATAVAVVGVIALVFSQRWWMLGMSALAWWAMRLWRETAVE